MSLLPNRTSRFFRMPSAVGLRHKFPVQIKITLGTESLPQGWNGAGEKIVFYRL